MYIRKFIEAVLDYTGAKEVDVISHSMGVPLSRRALKGGWSSVPVVDIVTGENEDRPFYIGKPLTDKVRHYIGIVGPNFGVINCTVPEYFDSYRGCNKELGFYPGSEAGHPLPLDMTPWLV